MLESLRFTTSSIKSRMYNLGLIIGSTRPARKGIAVAEWITNLARNQKNFNVEVLDLKEINLPFMDEQHHPRLKKYEHEHTRQWSRTIENKDAFIFVSPEYNYGFSAPLKNRFGLYQNGGQNVPSCHQSYYLLPIFLKAF